jgi:pimeloyl-ACP methyl ester carboxylesterase
MLQRSATLQSTPERVAFNRAMWRSFGRPENDVRQLATHIKAPTLLVFGKHDPAIPAGRDGKEAMKCIPSAKMVILPSGHEAFAEVPELFLKEVQPFFSQLR